MGKGESLGGLVSKLGCNLHKSPGVVGSRTTQPREDMGRHWGTVEGRGVGYRTPCPTSLLSWQENPSVVKTTVSDSHHQFGDI